MLIPSLAGFEPASSLIANTLSCLSRSAKWHHKWSIKSVIPVVYNKPTAQLSWLMGRLCLCQLLKTHAHSHSKYWCHQMWSTQTVQPAKWARKGIKMLSLLHTSLFLSFWHLCVVSLRLLRKKTQFLKQTELRCSVYNATAVWFAFNSNWPPACC